MMIHLLHAAFVYQAPDGEVEALRDVSLDVEEGEFCSIVGPSGCGKSTLLSALAGLEPLTGGEIAVDGETILQVRFTNFAFCDTITETS